MANRWRHERTPPLTHDELFLTLLAVQHCALPTHSQIGNAAQLEALRAKLFAKWRIAEDKADVSEEEHRRACNRLRRAGDQHQKKLKRLDRLKP